MDIITEGKAKVRSYTQKIVDKKMPVFYNPEKGFDRSLSVFFARATMKKGFRFMDLLAASGLRGIRMALEAGADPTFNDRSNGAAELIRKNLKRNRIKSDVYSMDGNAFMHTTKDVFDFIDIDPFGSPIYYISSSIERLRDNGFLSITATDTASLFGTYPNTCMRRYGSINFRTPFSHETGLRILIKKAIEIGAEKDIALMPVFSHHTRHYYRAYFQKKKGASRADKLLEKLQFIHYNSKTMQRSIWKCEKERLGKIYTGELNNRDIVKKMKGFGEELFLQKLENEVDIPWHFDIHKICKQFKLNMCRHRDLIESLKKKGFSASETHFSPEAIKTNAGINDVIKTIKSAK